MDPAETKAAVDLPALEDRVRRDGGRSSMAVAWLLALSLIAVVYAVNWAMNSANGHRLPEPEKPVKKPVGDANRGRAGYAVELGEAPEPDDTLPAIVDLDKEVKEKIDDLLKLAEDVPGDGGGPSGFDKVGVGLDKGDPKHRRRWTIEWGQDTEVGYRKKLDHFGIVLGAVRGGQLLGAKSRFAAGTPETVVKPPERWFVHQDRTRVELDRKLLADAGVAVAATDVVAQFFPRELSDKLAAVEKAHSHKNDADIERTVFGVRPAGAGFEFYVIEQRLK